MCDSMNNVPKFQVIPTHPESYRLLKAVHLAPTDNVSYPFKDEAQTALFKDPFRTAL